MNNNNINPTYFQQQNPLPNMSQPNKSNQINQNFPNQTGDVLLPMRQNYPNTNFHPNSSTPNNLNLLQPSANGVTPQLMNMSPNLQDQMMINGQNQMNMGQNPQVQMNMNPNLLAQMNMGQNPQAQMNMNPNLLAQMNMCQNPQAQMNMYPNPLAQMNMGQNPQAQINMGRNTQVQMNMISNPQAQNMIPNISDQIMNQNSQGQGFINPNYVMPAQKISTITNTSTKEKELQNKINELQDQLKEQENDYEQKITKEKNSSKSTSEGLKKDIQELQDEISELKNQIYKLKGDNSIQQQKIDKITKEKTSIEKLQKDLEDQVDELQQQNQQLQRRQVVNYGISTPQQQFNQPFLQDNDNQIKKNKEEIKKLKEDLTKQKTLFEEELEIVQNKLVRSEQQIEKEHQYFMEARDEILKLKQVIKQKDEKIYQQDNQQMNSVDALKKVNMEKQRLEDQIRQKDFEIETLNNQINLFQKQLDQLRNLINDLSTGKQVNLDQKQYFQKFEEQQKYLDDKKKMDEQKLEQELKIKQKEREDRLEQDKIKKEKERQHLEQKKGNQLQQVNQNMQQAKKEYGQLDVCFIVDVTGSMDSYKDQTKRSVQGSLQIIKQATNRETNWASVCYQDKDELKQLGKYYEFPFSKDQKALEKWFDGIKCSGGGDAAEDIRGAIKQVCKLSWPSRFRIAIIICDAPCHGRKYNGGCNDYYPDEDIIDAIEELIEKNIVLIALNFKTPTTVMYQEIKKIYESKKKQDLFLFQDLQKMNQNEVAVMMQKYIGEASQNATQTNKNQTKSKQGANQQEVVREKEGAMEALCKQGNFYKFEEQPNVKTLKTRFQVWRVEIKDEAFDKNIETIFKIECPQDFYKNNEGTWDCIRTEKPFAFGMMKDVFLMKKLSGNSDELYVIKTPIGSKPYSTMDDALKECKSHLICQKLMKKFVGELQEQVNEKKMDLKIPSVKYSDFLILEESKNSFWIAERFFQGEFVKYNNNYGFINEDNKLELNKFAQSFTYYTYITSNFNYMICDVQGVGNYFTDPAINTHKGNFDDTDMGEEGYMMYLVNYENKKSELTKKYLDLLGIYE